MLTDFIDFFMTQFQLYGIELVGSFFLAVSVGMFYHRGPAIEGLKYLSFAF